MTRLEAVRCGKSRPVVPTAGRGAFIKPDLLVLFKTGLAGARVRAV
jgi:hypothetical protein